MPGPVSAETRRKISAALKGRMPKCIPSNKGRERTPEHRRKISETLKAKGIKPPRPPRESICRGERHMWWRGGVTDPNEAARKSLEYRQWRKAVFERDDFTCVECGTRGARLHADHKKPFALFPELRFDVDNGRTMCEDCHRQTDTYGTNTNKHVWGNESTGERLSA